MLCERTRIKTFATSFMYTIVQVILFIVYKSFVIQSPYRLTFTMVA